MAVAESVVLDQGPLLERVNTFYAAYNDRYAQGRPPEAVRDWGTRHIPRAAHANATSLRV